MKRGTERIRCDFCGEDIGDATDTYVFSTEKSFFFACSGCAKKISEGEVLFPRGEADGSKRHELRKSV